MSVFSPAPMEHLKAFALAFVAGLLTALSWVGIAKAVGARGRL